MESFYLYYQNPSVHSFLVQIRAFVILTSLGLPDLNMKEKNEVNSGLSGKKRSSCKWPIDTRMIIYLFSC